MLQQSVQWMASHEVEGAEQVTSDVMAGGGGESGGEGGGDSGGKDGGGDGGGGDAGGDAGGDGTVSCVSRRPSSGRCR